MNTLNFVRSLVAASALSFALLSAPAQAAVDFNSDPTTDFALDPGSSILSGGYTFFSTSRSAVVSGNGILDNGSYWQYGVYNGTNMLVFDGVSGTLTVTRTGGGLFSLSSLDVGRWLGLQPNNTARLSITGHTQSSGDVWIDSSLSTTSFNTLSTPSFSNLLSLTMRITGYSSSAYAAIDNLVLAAVPEPETYALMLAGLGLLGILARRRKAGLL